MAEDFYPFVDSGDPAPDNSHLNGLASTQHDNTDANTGNDQTKSSTAVNYATRISIYDDMLSTPRIVVVNQQDTRTYLEEITNTVYRVMKEQGGRISLMVIRELVENFIHAHFTEPVISILDGGNTIRFADQGPGIADKERAFEFGVTSANRDQKRYIRGTGAGLPMVQQYLENAGGAVSIEDNLNQGTVVTVSVDAARVEEIGRTVSRGAAVRGSAAPPHDVAVGGYPMQPGASAGVMSPAATATPAQRVYQPVAPAPQTYPYPAMPGGGAMWNAGGYFPVSGGYQQAGNQFSTIPQQGAQPAGFYQQTIPAYPAQRPASQMPYVSERGGLALHFLLENTLGGPTDLAGRFEGSPATWSRELGILAETGLVIKHGKKYMLTEMGKAWTQQA